MRKRKSRYDQGEDESVAMIRRRAVHVAKIGVVTSGNRKSTNESVILLLMMTAKDLERNRNIIKSLRGEEN